MSTISNHLKSDWYKYLLDTIVVVLGILVAFNLNSWKESVKHQKNVEQMYGDLAQELRTDLIEIQGNRIYNQKYLARYNYASNIILEDREMKLADTLAFIAIELTNFSDFKKAEIAYDKLTTSGKIDLFDNKGILKQLQDLGTLYTYINRLEKNHEDLMFMIVPRISDHIRIKPLKVIHPEELYGYKFHNNLQFFIKVGNEKEGLYKSAETKLNDIITALENELN